MTHENYRKYKFQCTLIKFYWDINHYLFIVYGFLLSTYTSCQNKRKREKQTSNVILLRHLEWSFNYYYWIRWQSIVFILQWYYNCAKRIQYRLTFPNKALITVFPTHRKAHVREIRNFKMEYFIIAKFLDKNKNWKWSCNQNKFLNGSFVRQARKVVY